MSRLLYPRVKRFLYPCIGIFNILINEEKRGPLSLPYFSFRKELAPQAKYFRYFSTDSVSIVCAHFHRKTSLFQKWVSSKLGFHE